MRPSTIVTLITAVVVALVSIAAAIFVYLDHNSGQFWFYWIAPLLAIGFAGMTANLVAQYFVKIGRLEIKGRPRAK